MGSLFRKKSVVDRKLEELQKESEKVRNTIKVLDRALKHSDSGALREWGETAAPEPLAPKTSQASASMAPGIPPSSPPTSPGGRRPTQMDHKFASYLTSGSFIPASPLREDRSVQKNKAIFMIVIVGVVAFVVYSLFKHF